MVNKLLAYIGSFCFLCSCLSIVGQSDQLSSIMVLHLHWHKYIDPIVMDTISYKDLSVPQFTNSFFDSCLCYFNILLLGTLRLFCYTFTVFYIFLPYSRPDCSSFFHVWYYILFMWLSIQFFIELWLVRLEQLALPMLFYSVLISI